MDNMNEVWYASTEYCGYHGFEIFYTRVAFDIDGNKTITRIDEETEEKEINALLANGYYIAGVDVEKGVVDYGWHGIINRLELRKKESGE